MPMNSPTCGSPVSSSSWTGAHSPEKSIWATAGMWSIVRAKNKGATTLTARVKRMSPPTEFYTRRAGGVHPGPGRHALLQDQLCVDWKLKLKSLLRGAGETRAVEACARDGEALRRDK